MAIRISGTTGIDMGNTSVSNVDVGVLAENAVTKQYVDDNVLLSPNDSRVKTALNASGEAPIYACRAWVNFNGTGTVAIRASGNVSSITDNGTGDYTVNFTTAMTDANYAFEGIFGIESSILDGESWTVKSQQSYTTTSSLRFVTYAVTPNVYNARDGSLVNIAIYR